MVSPREEKHASGERRWRGSRIWTEQMQGRLVNLNRGGGDRKRRNRRRSLGRNDTAEKPWAGSDRKGEGGEMGIRFVLLVNKQGQTRLAQYYEHLSLDERRALEGEIVRKCLARTDQQCSFVEHRNYKVVYRRYASLFFLVGVDNDEVRIPPALCPVFLTLLLLYYITVIPIR
ncbi:hypothetical protein VPH35_103613 [Triticum aestivum]